MTSKKVSHPTWPGLTPLQRAVEARVQYDTYDIHRGRGSVEHVTIDPKDVLALDAQAEWRRARQEAIAAGVSEADLGRAVTKMVQLHRATVAVWAEIGGPVPSGTREQQARFRRAEEAAVAFAMKLGFTKQQGHLLSTRRQNR